MVVYNQVGTFTPIQVHAINKNNSFHPGCGRLSLVIQFCSPVVASSPSPLCFIALRTVPPRTISQSQTKRTPHSPALVPLPANTSNPATGSVDTLLLPQTQWRTNLLSLPPGSLRADPLGLGGGM